MSFLTRPWRVAATRQSLLTRHLVVSARGMQTPASSAPSSPSSSSSSSDLTTTTSHPRVSVVDAGRDAESKAFALGLAHDRFFTLHRPLIPDHPPLSTAAGSGSSSSSSGEGLAIQAPPTPNPTSSLSSLSPLDRMGRGGEEVTNSQMWASRFLQDLASRVSSIPPSTQSTPVIQATSVLRKRRVKMNKHKYKKLRKRTRALRRKLGR
ncbi:MAG: hypothetical protein DHS80DRAFT_31161 [Piptocephalis tieghemiana]|nr:MAG: hypothetical protein DHS80DRAFT_31161 [Piptocephalis tieghemiana]